MGLLLVCERAMGVRVKRVVLTIGNLRLRYACEVPLEYGAVCGERSSIRERANKTCEVNVPWLAIK